MSDDFRVNEDVLNNLLAPDINEPTPALADLVAAMNPDYQVERIRSYAPFDTAAELIGATAGRVYFRLQNEVVSVALSDRAMMVLADQIHRALGV